MQNSGIVPLKTCHLKDCTWKERSFDVCFTGVQTNSMCTLSIVKTNYDLRKKINFTISNFMCAHKFSSLPNLGLLDSEIPECKKQIGDSHDISVGILHNFVLFDFWIGENSFYLGFESYESNDKP